MKRFTLLLCFIFAFTFLSGCGESDNTIRPEIKQQAIDLIHNIDNAKVNQRNLSVAEIDDILYFANTKDMSKAEKDVSLEVMNLANSIEDIVQNKPNGTTDFDTAYKKLQTYLGNL